MNTQARDKARDAIAYMLRRIQSDPRLAYWMASTEALRKLCDAHSELSGDDPDDFRDKFNQDLRTEAPQCRSGECIQRAERTNKYVVSAPYRSNGAPQVVEAASAAAACAAFASAVGLDRFDCRAELVEG